MRVVVVYESMYGNTRVIAEAIAGAFNPAEVAVLPVAHADPDALKGAGLLVVGAPTHAFGMSRAKTRQAAADAARKPGSGLALEPAALGRGVREWLDSLSLVGGTAAAFDTRIRVPFPSGHASRGIGKLLRHRGYELLTRPQSFFVTKDNVLRPGEADRARRWGEQLAARVSLDATRTDQPS
jgi:hypothetical protein